MTGTSKTLGIDIGGSGIKGAVVDVTTGEFTTERHRLDTPQPATPESISQTLKSIVDFFEWRGPIGCTFPAIIDNGHARSASNVHDSCRDADLASIFGEATGCALVVLNDADAAPSARVRAALGVLEHVHRTQGVEELEGRIKSLEESLAAREGTESRRWAS